MSKANENNMIFTYSFGGFMLLFIGFSIWGIFRYGWDETLNAIIKYVIGASAFGMVFIIASFLMSRRNGKGFFWFKR